MTKPSPSLFADGNLAEEWAAAARHVTASLDTSEPDRRPENRAGQLTMIAAFRSRVDEGWGSGLWVATTR